MNSLLFILMMLSITSLYSCTSSGNMPIQSKQSLYDRVMQSGKIRCGYITYLPGCIRDPNTGKLSGIGVEAIELIGKKLGLTIEWTEEIAWGTMLEGLQTGRYDMIATPVWSNAHRAKIVSFSRPLYYSPVLIFVRKGDTRFKNHWELINNPNITISTIDGTSGELIARTDFPKAKKFSMPESSAIAQNLLNVSSGKADLTFAELTNADLFMHNNPRTVDNLNPEKPIRLFGCSWLFYRGEDEFKAMLDTVLDELINSGVMDKIIDKYTKAPNEIYRTALPYQAPQ